MTPLTMTDPRWANAATVDTLAAGLNLAWPVRVIVPPDGDRRWREPCSICHQSRAECAAWEAHQIQRRQAYAERIGIRYELWRCGRCGEPVGASGVQRDGLRYCGGAHAEPATVLVYEHEHDELVGEGGGGIR